MPTLEKLIITAIKSLFTPHMVLYWDIPARKESSFPSADESDLLEQRMDGKPMTKEKVQYLAFFVVSIAMSKFYKAEY